MIKVIVDTDLCQSNGLCALAAPEVFELGDDDLLRWKEEVDESRRAEVTEAEQACPVMAIRLERDRELEAE